jgi:hypothetical protein
MEKQDTSIRISKATRDKLKVACAETRQTYDAWITEHLSGTSSKDAFFKHMNKRHKNS